MLNRSASLAMSTSVLKALPSKLNIKLHSHIIHYILCNIICMIHMIAIIAYRKGLKKQKEVLRELKEMFNASSIFEIDSTTNVLMVRFIT